MKKSTRIITSLVLSLLITVSLCFACYAKIEFDMEKAISEFSETAFNVKELELGSSTRHNAALWADGGLCVSSNENVVSVDEKGVVTAKGTGTAYVAICASTGMYQVERYTVVEKLSGSNMSFGGIDYDNILSIPNIDDQNDLLESAQKQMSGFFIFFWIFFSLVLTFLIYTIITIITLSKTSMRTRVLPPVGAIAQSPVGLQKIHDKCPDCGHSFDGANFCPNCGKSAKVTYTYRFPISGKMNGIKFETAINQWFAQNPNIEDCKVSLELHNSLFNPLVYHKFFVREAVIEFTLSEKMQNSRYGMAFIYKFRPFGPIGFSEKKHVEKWLENNRDCTVVSHQGGRIQHFDSNGGFYAQYYNYVLFKK